LAKCGALSASGTLSRLVTNNIFEICLRMFPRDAEIPTTSVIARAWNWLASDINKGLRRHAAPELVVRLQPPTTRIWLAPKNLMGALWIQAALAVHERRLFWDCQECSDPFALPNKSDSELVAKIVPPYAGLSLTESGRKRRASYMQRIGRPRRSRPCSKQNPRSSRDG